MILTYTMCRREKKSTLGFVTEWKPIMYGRLGNRWKDEEQERNI